MTDPSRILPFRTITNCRDLGGYQTVDGRMVRRGRVYRSGALHNLGDDERPRFLDLGLRAVLDLRRPDEIDADGQLDPGLGVKVDTVNLCGVSWVSSVPPTLANIAEDFGQKYLNLAVAGISGDNVVGRALRFVADPAHTPVLFHCAAGKDRTGVLAALILSLLGVDDATVVADYALSEYAVRQDQEAWLHRAVARGNLGPEWLADPDWRRTALRRGDVGPAWVLRPAPSEAMVFLLGGLRRRYGSVAGYAAAAGFGPRRVAALRERLVVDA